MSEVWGPASPLAVAMELDDRKMKDRWRRSLSVHLYGQYGPDGIVLPYVTPSYVLRRRAMYGGRKGRAAIKRLRSRGCRPIADDRSKTE